MKAAFHRFLVGAAVLVCALACRSLDPVSRKLAAPLRDQILARAEASLDREPVTITAFRCPRSEGGLHDFYSEGDYWWPNPANPDGPYIRRDGESNPDNFSEHRHAMEAFSRTVGTLTSAWMLTGEPRFAQAAERQLRAWFVDTLTRMSPSLLYAQAIKGVVSGRGIGIIDTIHLLEPARAVQCLSEAGALSEECARGCKAWFRDYLDWLNTHPYGIAEMRARNNHGTWWYAQAAAFARLLGDEAQLDRCRKAYKEYFLPKTMASDGSFPDELARTKPYNYSIFQLNAMVLLCQLLSSQEDDLWAYTTPDGKNIRTALDFQLPYIINKDSWPYAQDVSHWDEWPVAVSAYAFAWAHYRDARYYRAWAPLEHWPAGAEMQRVSALNNPLIWL